MKVVLNNMESLGIQYESSSTEVRSLPSWMGCYYFVLVFDSCFCCYCFVLFLSFFFSTYGFFESEILLKSIVCVCEC